MSLNTVRFGRARTSIYFDNIDISNDFAGEPVVIDQRIACVSFQGIVRSGVAMGEIKAQLSIIEGVWTDLAGCEPITVDLSQNNDFLIIIPDQTAYAGALRLLWTAGQGSTGTLEVQQRIMLP